MRSWPAGSPTEPVPLNADGFEGFELLRPTDERTTWLVVTRWRDKEAFEAWVASPAFAYGHRGASHEGGSRPPVGTHSELWSYEVEVAAPRARA